MKNLTCEFLRFAQNDKGELSIFLLKILDVQQVTHLGVLGVHIELVFLVASHLNRLAANDLEPETVETVDLGRVVGHEAELVDAEIGKDRSACAILAQVGSEAEGEVRLDGVHALILQVIGAQLVDEADATTLLTQVEEHAAATRFDAAQCLGQLLATVAAETAERIARETF